mgnify:CR=1 FL=1
MFAKLTELWNKIPFGIRACIEFFFSVAFIFTLYGVYCQLIPKNLALKDEYITWVGLVGFVVTSWGFIKSWQAASRAEKIENSLIEVGLLSSGIKEDFSNIFNEHLIKEIHSFKNTPGNIYLSLSTPAYGYGVLGKIECQKLYDSFNNIHPVSKIELIIFSPDAHYNYWANLIFWSISKDLGDDFINNFAVFTHEIIDLLSSKKCSIWLKKETTVRFFAYESSDRDKKAYVSLVDSISIYQNQFGTGFKARSLPIQRTQLNNHQLKLVG